MVIVQQGPLLAMFPSVTHVVLGERNKYVGKSDREHGEEKRNNKRQWRRDKLRKKKNAQIRGKDEESNREGGERKTKGMEAMNEERQ